MSIRIGFMSNTSDSQLRFIQQMGVTDVVTSLRAEERGDVWGFEPMLRLRKKVEDAGLTLSVFEGIPVPDRAKLGLPGRDEDIDNYCESLRNMGRAGIPVVCYNWMVAFGWLRTSTTTPVRGGAVATTYDHEEMQRGPLTEHGEVGEDLLWKALEYFLKAVVPVAEESGVKLAMHPCDPPLSPIRGIGRIMTSPENFQRLIDLVPSPNNGLTFCQGCFTEMGVDIAATIHDFGKQGKIFFSHFRNLNGTAAKFTEQFHDDGQQDMYVAMKAYYDAGVEGSIRPDHAPTMEGDDNSHPGYALQGRLLAVGYMRGLMEAIEKAGGA
jgi:mannonate dehydratase